VDLRIKSEDPLDPSNRRIPLIVQHESRTDSGAESAEKERRGNGESGGKEGGAEEPKHGSGSSSEAKSEPKKE
jgi:hypothetical protein